MKKLFFFSVIAVLLAGCQEKWPAVSQPDDPHIAQANSITISDESYTFVRGSYNIYYHDFLLGDVVCLSIDFTNSASIIIEMQKGLLGERIVLGPTDAFWFFSFGNAMDGFRSFENSDADFSDYTGWFTADVDESTREGSFAFEIIREGELVAEGRISGLFTWLTGNNR